MKKFLLAGATVLAVATSPAFAQDGTYETSGREPFTGVYVGGAIEYGAQGNDRGSGLEFDRNLDGRFGDTVTTATGANAFSPGFCKGAATQVNNRGCRNDNNDIGYYGRVGADYQFVGSPFVVGIVGEFGKTQIRDYVTGFSTTPAFYTMAREIEWEGGIRGRAGFAANDTLFYGTAGAGYARIKNRFVTSNTANSFTDNGNNNEWGFLAGGGIEHKFSRNISLGLEYMYHQYRDDGYRVRVGQGTAPATNPFVLAPNTTGTDIRRSDEQFRWHSARAVANFRF